MYLTFDPCLQSSQEIFTNIFKCQSPNFTFFMNDPPLGNLSIRWWVRWAHVVITFQTLCLGKISIISGWNCSPTSLLLPCVLKCFFMFLKGREMWHLLWRIFNRFSMASAPEVGGRSNWSMRDVRQNIFQMVTTMLWSLRCREATLQF